MIEIKDMQVNEHSLAYELLVELKHSAKRWFVAFCIMIGLEIATIIGFMWYLSLPADEYEIIQTSQDVDNESTVNQNVGDTN